MQGFVLPAVSGLPFQQKYAPLLPVVSQLPASKERLVFIPWQGGCSVVRIRLLCISNLIGRKERALSAKAEALSLRQLSSHGSHHGEEVANVILSG